MASSFKRKTSSAVGVAATKIGAYDIPAGVSATAIGLNVSNITANTIKVSVSLYDGAVDTYLVKNMDIIPGQAHSLIGGDQKIVLLPGDSIRVVSDTAGSVDAILSLLELS